jgi:uncharacterized protein (DUF58 family)
VSASSLLDPAFVRELEQLRVELSRRIAGVRVGEHRSLRRGASVEFAEHRAYAPGDDPRRVDWNAFARLGELVVRLYAAEEDVTVHLVVDASRSMAFGEPTKLSVAARVAAAIGYLCLTGSERVSLSVSVGAEVATRATLRGRRKLPELLSALEAIDAKGRGPVERAVDVLLARHAGRPGVAVVLSDLFDEGAAISAARKLSAARHETAVVHTLSAAELDPEALGEATLVDSETGERLDLALDDATLEAYRARLSAWRADAEGALRKRGVRYVRAFPGDGLRDVVARVLVRG